MGVKLGARNAIIGAEKCGSCNFRNGMHCGLTGGTLLSFPGMSQTTSNKIARAGAPEDGRSILKEFDLMEKTAQADIDMTPPIRTEIHFGSSGKKTAEWKGWTEDMPVRVVGVVNNRITPNGSGYQDFSNLDEARKVFPDINPDVNGQRFCWAMQDSVNGKPTIRFET
jgi:hypothetical protein